MNYSALNCPSPCKWEVNDRLQGACVYTKHIDSATHVLKKPCGTPRSDYVITRASTLGLPAAKDDKPYPADKLQRDWMTCNSPCEWVPNGAGQPNGACLYRKTDVFPPQYKMCGQDYKQYSADPYSPVLAQPTTGKSMSTKSVLSTFKKSVKMIEDVKALMAALDKTMPECVNARQTIQDLVGKLRSIDGKDQEAIACALRKYIVDNRVTLTDSGLFTGTKEQAALFTNIQVLDVGDYGGVLSCSVANLSPNFISVKYNKAYNPLPMLYELYMGKVVNIVRRKLPNFVYTYGGFYCSPPQNDRGLPDMNMMCSDVNNPDVVLLTELVPDSMALSRLMRGESLNGVALDGQGLRDIVLQVLFAANQMYFEAGLQHNDIHGNNVLVRLLPQPITIQYTVYFNELSNTTVQVTTRWLAVLYDYTNSIHIVDQDYVHMLKLEARLKPLIHPLKDFMTWYKVDSELFKRYMNYQVVKAYIDAYNEYNKKFTDLKTIQQVLQRFINMATR